MCTLAVSFRQHSQWPVMVAANRDEALDRPASGPVRWPGEPFVAPRDEVARGTWLGLTAGGMFVGVTNRFPSTKHLDRESRGTLVVEALRHPGPAALHATLATLNPHRFNDFHLVYADRSAAFLTWSDGAAVHQRTLEPGLHIVTERSLGGDDSGRRQLIDELWPTLAPKGEAPSPEALQRLLGTVRPGDPLNSLTVDVPAFNYGTRSALVLLLGQALADSRFFWADGRPDRTPFVERADLVRNLAA